MTDDDVRNLRKKIELAEDLQRRIAYIGRLRTLITEKKNLSEGITAINDLRVGKELAIEKRVSLERQCFEHGAMFVLAELVKELKELQ